jgi:hypothetical protein
MDQRNVSVPGNITTKWFPIKLAYMFKGQFDCCASNCSELMWIDRNMLEDNISQYA